MLGRFFNAIFSDRGETFCIFTHNFHNVSRSFEKKKMARPVTAWYKDNRPNLLPKLVYTLDTPV